MAPELLASKYGKECDVWSAGVILHLLISGHYPFIGDHQFEVYQAIKNIPVRFRQQEFAVVSDLAKDLIQKLLTKDPKSRISAKKALEHSWFKHMKYLAKKR
jgi:calcium-dependent protein kinase